ncbi:MAG: U6 snRNA-associated Sm-like protein LSm6 [Desulfurococcales archaeon]|nr:U6 snRNA-associated Sm-like protein LSm6 [Desulfurococcales archaeon]
MSQLNPIRYLRSMINKEVYVRLKDGSEYIGKLIATDTTMNLVLDEAKRLQGGGREVKAVLGKVFIRGSMIQYISFEPEKAAYEALTS